MEGVVAAIVTRIPVWASLRNSERIYVCYFVYTAALSLFLNLPNGTRVRTFAVNAAVIGSYYLIARRKERAWDIARDWIPQALAFLAYKQAGWFAPPTHDYSLEHGWIVWDRLFLHEWGGRAVIESIPGLPLLLELSYLLVYAVPPFAVAAFYFMHKRERVDAMLVIYSLGLLLAYGQFPAWPSEPPRTVFPGMDAPTADNVLRRVNLFLVGGYGIHTSVFPSAHVSGAFSAAFAFWMIAGRRPFLQIGFTLYAVLVSVATVYGRYHYAVDAVAGLAVAIAAAWIGSVIIKHSRPDR
jgi:membrane-associated phospholipid phosphatase